MDVLRFIRRRSSKLTRCTATAEAYIVRRRWRYYTTSSATYRLTAPFVLRRSTTDAAWLRRRFRSSSYRLALRWVAIGTAASVGSSTSSAALAKLGVSGNIASL